MIVLGLDTATSATAVGLKLADSTVLEARDDPPAGAHPGHATRLLVMAGELLGEAGLRWAELDRLAVGVGPGTFTGLRVGIASARGLAQSLDAELTGVSSLRALAHAAAPTVGTRGGVLAAIDARRGEVFLAAYGEGGRELLAPRAVAPDGLEEAMGERTELSSWTAVGDGAIRYREAFERLGAVVPVDSDPLHLVRGRAICELAEAQETRGDATEVLPDYCRRPDAELSLASPQGASGR